MAESSALALHAEVAPSIPGAFGCTAESCTFRDLGAAVCGLSTRPQRRATRSSTNYDGKLSEGLGLPTWCAGRHRLLKRFTLITPETLIEHVLAPVGDPAGHAHEVATWLGDRRLEPFQ
ncbi:MAG TPA: hypothetical protein VMU34_11135 [Mycobacterium sp.]|nr:hypothetical protein [Mycobacterium sp.]